METKSFEYEITILEKHLDTFGHVNNAVYLELFEEARWDFITKNGYGLKEVQEKKIGPVILELNLKFKKELVNREKIVIKSHSVDVVKNKFFILQQQMINEKGDVCSVLDITFGLMDLSARKLIDGTPEWLKAMGL